jgi:hypothetical protein
VDEDPHQAHPQPRPADSASIPAGLPEPCRDAPRAASARHLAAYSQLSRDSSRPAASGGY